MEGEIVNRNEADATHIGMSDWNIKSITSMPTPGELKREIPLSPEVFNKVVNASREIIYNIFTGEDRRLLVVVGPCSVHNIAEAEEYARNLAAFAPEVADQLYIVMRLCLDKPRTGRGWAGFFQDPDLNESRNMDKGWRQGRELIVKILSMGLPIGLEFLDVDVCQNIDECVSYWWIGARTVKAQRLREIASGMSPCVGFKNPTDGKIDDAIEGMNTAWHETAFIAPNEKGQRCEYRTNGNKHVNLILRGSDNGSNYDKEAVAEAVRKLTHRGLPNRVLIDASHKNSGKDHTKQRDVIYNIAERVAAGEEHIAGFLYESYLEEGNQPLPKDLSNLKPRISITDACDDWETTKKVLLRAREILAKRT